MSANVVSLNSSSLLLECGLMYFTLIFITIGDFFQGCLIEKIRKQLTFVLRCASFYCITRMKTVHFPCMVLFFFQCSVLDFSLENVRGRTVFPVNVVSNSIREILILMGVLE